LIKRGEDISRAELVAARETGSQGQKKRHRHSPEFENQEWEANAAKKVLGFMLTFRFSTDKILRSFSEPSHRAFAVLFVELDSVQHERCNYKAFYFRCISRFKEFAVSDEKFVIRRLEMHHFVPEAVPNKKQLHFA
jgi:hypothetical protein